jgi:serpin B
LFAEKIKDLFPDGSLSSSTKLVVINTVYFKGQWDREFKKDNTKEEAFWLNKVRFFIYMMYFLVAL